MNYAGFWLRLVAIIIDGIILSIFSWLVLTPILATLGFVSNFSFMDLQNIEDATALIGMLAAIFGIAWFVGRVIDIIYHSFMESSKFQGSVGKLALGIVVTDMNGQKLTFSKAVVRNICKLISSFVFCIGYIIAGFTEKKQGLHDIIAGTLVVRKNNSGAI